MSLYLDSSALLKRYREEPDSDACRRILESDPAWVTARHTAIEIRRSLARDLDGEELSAARQNFERDWALMAVVELDEQTCGSAAEIAELTRARTLEALHLAAAQRAGGGSLPFVTFDLRQAQIARSLGWPVLGV